MPSEDSIYVSGKSGQFWSKLSGKSGHKGFAKLPAEVLQDSRLSFAARCTYAVIALYAIKSNTVEIGYRRMARYLGCHTDTVGSAICELEKLGYLNVAGEGKRRRAYILTSRWFAGEQAKPTAAQRPTCPGCKHTVVQLGKAGLCRGCVRDANLERAYRGAVAVLGAAATVEQVAVYLHRERITADLLRVARRVELAA